MEGMQNGEDAKKKRVKKENTESTLAHVNDAKPLAAPTQFAPTQTFAPFGGERRYISYRLPFAQIRASTVPCDGVKMTLLQPLASIASLIFAPAGEAVGLSEATLMLGEGVGVGDGVGAGVVPGWNLAKPASLLTQPVSRHALNARPWGDA